jgi:hypothetical protein
MNQSQVRIRHIFCRHTRNSVLSWVNAAAWNGTVYKQMCQQKKNTTSKNVKKDERNPAHEFTVIYNSTSTVTEANLHLTEFKL